MRNRFVSLLGALEAHATELMKLSRQLRSPRKKNASPSSLNSDATNGTGVGIDVGSDNAPGVGDEGIPTEEEGPIQAVKEPGLLALAKTWWASKYPYEGAAGFGLMREEMLFKANAQQVVTLSGVLIVFVDFFFFFFDNIHGW